MPKLVVQGQVFDYPEPGSEAGWGQDATGWAEAVNQAIASLLGPGDILETTALILNNQSTLTDVVGLSFANNVVRAANVQYAIYRSTETPEALAESGTLYITFNNLTNAFTISQVKNAEEEAGVVFSITSSGQVQYTSSSMSGTGYSGIITFKAQTLSQ